MGNTYCKFLVEAGFICYKVTTRAAVLRANIFTMFCTVTVILSGQLLTFISKQKLIINYISKINCHYVKMQQSILLLALLHNYMGQWIKYPDFLSSRSWLKIFFFIILCVSFCQILILMASSIPLFCVNKFLIWTSLNTSCLILALLFFCPNTTGIIKGLHKL